MVIQHRIKIKNPCIGCDNVEWFSPIDITTTTPRHENVMVHLIWLRDDFMTHLTLAHIYLYPGKTVCNFVDAFDCYMTSRGRHYKAITLWELILASCGPFSNTLGNTEFVMKSFLLRQPLVTFISLVSCYVIGRDKNGRHNKFWYIEMETKQPFCRRHFQMYFMQ